MKIRAGFVSNSSSSSFALGKYFMTETQVKQLREFLKENYEDSNIDPNIYEIGAYFMGRYSHHDGELFPFLEKIGIKLENVGLFEDD